MKKSFGIKLFAFALMALVVTACSKYEEGSKFTLLSKKSRVANTWTLASYTVDGTSQTLSGTTTWELTKEGGATLTVSGGGFSFSDSGSWAFGNDKQDLVLTDSDGDTETYEIVMLKSKDLKLRQTTTVLGTDVVTVLTFSGE